MTAGQLEQVAGLVRAAGYRVTVEHPGCVVVRYVAGFFWWGTANGYWDADLCAADGAGLGGATLRSDPAVYAEEPDPAVVAAAIVRAMDRLDGPDWPHSDRPACTNSPACRDAGCDECERSYGPRRA